MQSFSFQRLGLLIKRDLGQNKKGYMITLGVLFSLYMFVVWFGRGVVSSSNDPTMTSSALNIFIYYTSDSPMCVPDYVQIRRHGADASPQVCCQPPMPSVLPLALLS